ncbi:MAG TPA: hypothetical protein VFX16_30490 [Pseudonocardiaceae bacterium]|nr:hypothetical protein [Pseudonocardiaceae bacterium]
MTAIVFFLVLIALIAVGLQHNHTRQSYRRAALAGSGTATDRDAERVVIDLAAAGREVTFDAATGTDPRSTIGIDRTPCAVPAASGHFAR